MTPATLRAAMAHTPAWKALARVLGEHADGVLAELTTQTAQVLSAAPEPPSGPLRGLPVKVLSRLHRVPTTPLDLSVHLDEAPQDIHQACEELAQRGLAQEVAQPGHRPRWTVTERGAAAARAIEEQ